MRSPLKKSVFVRGINEPNDQHTTDAIYPQPTAIVPSHRNYKRHLKVWRRHCNQLFASRR